MLLAQLAMAKYTPATPQVTNMLSNADSIDLVAMPMADLFMSTHSLIVWPNAP